MDTKSEIVGFYGHFEKVGFLRGVAGGKAAGYNAQDL
jgi:hypothetical protein